MSGTKVRSGRLSSAAGRLACVAALLLSPAKAEAAVQRFALLVGNNRGQDVELFAAAVPVDGDPFEA